MAYVYWVRLPEHTDMFSQGYIGVTTQTVKARFSQHVAKSKKSQNLPFQNALRKYGSDLIVETILIGEVEYVYDVEKQLRPKSRIGWNCAQGGDKSSLGRINKIISSEHRIAISSSLSGRKHSDFHIASMRISMKDQWSKRNRGSGSATNVNHSVWSIADLIYEDRMNGMSGGAICKKYQIAKLSSIHSMIYVHFKKGWVPSSDLEWLGKYKGGNLNGGSFTRTY